MTPLSGMPAKLMTRACLALLPALVLGLAATVLLCWPPAALAAGEVASAAARAGVDASWVFIGAGAATGASSATVTSGSNSPGARISGPIICWPTPSAVSSRSASAIEPPVALAMSHAWVARSNTAIVSAVPPGTVVERSRKTKPQVYDLGFLWWRGQDLNL